MGVGFGVLAIITEPPTTTTSTPTPSTCDRAGNKERLAEIRVLLHLVSEGLGRHTRCTFREGEGAMGVGVLIKCFCFRFVFV